MKHKILVVDDEWSMRELLKNTLMLSGFDVLLAKDAVEFRQIALNEKLDLIILDILLGDHDGTRVYADLVTEGLEPSTPVVFLSALAEDRPPTFPQPGRRYALVGKPFDPSKLVDRLQKFLAATN